MNSFGLGLVLNFVDNATAGMNNATRAFQQMSITADSVCSSVSTSIADIVTASYALDAVGSTLMNTGSSIISLYSDVSQSVIDAGMEMQGYRMQLSALYGSVEAGEAKMDEIKQYAMSSVFDIQSLIPAVTTMKAVGIEAMNEITTSSGQNTQKLLDYASDLAAMMPNMRNAYGTGVSAAMGAFKEYIAEGNAMSLKRGAGLDITQILGEDKGASIEERTQQVADLIEKLNIVGYTANLAGTPTQRLSNMQDALFNSLTKIADSGVFEKYCDLLEKLSNWVFSLVEDEETFNTITGVLADTVTTLLSPLESLLDFLIENGNAIMNWIKEHPKLTKNILLTVAAVGALLVAGGAVLKFIASLGMAAAGLKFLKSLPTLLSTLGGGFGALVTKALPFVALAAGLYFAWKNNIFGIRDLITELGEIISIAFDALGDYELSEENFQRAKELGVLPFIEALLQLKYHWGFLVEGFKTGFKSFTDGVAKALQSLGILDIDLGGTLGTLGEFIQSLFQAGSEENWQKVGEVVGYLVGALVSLVVFTKTLSFITKVLSPIVQVITGIGKAIKWVISFIGTTFGSVLAVISGIVMAAVGFIKQLNEGFSWFWEIIKWIGLALATVGAILLGVAAWPAVIVAAIVGAVTTIIVLVKQYWNEICAFFVTIGTWIYDNVISPVAQFFVGLWEGILTGVSNFINGLVSFFQTAVTKIKEFFTPIVEFFQGVWDGIVRIFSAIGTAVSDAITGAVRGAINAVLSGAIGIINGFIRAINTAISIINAIPGVNIGYLSTLNVPQLATGAVVDKPTLAEVGEDGKEAVIPLEKNTEGLDLIAQKIAPRLNAQPQLQGGSKSVEEHNDYSVTFAAGSIVIQLVNATDAELEKAAEKLMKIIERKQQLKAMASRA